MTTIIEEIEGIDFILGVYENEIDAQTALCYFLNKGHDAYLTN